MTVATAGRTLVAGAGGGGSTTLDALTDTDLTGAVGERCADVYLLVLLTNGKQ